MPRILSQYTALDLNHYDRPSAHVSLVVLVQEALVSDVQLFLETQAEIDKVVLVQAIERGRLTRRRLDIRT